MLHLEYPVSHTHTHTHTPGVCALALTIIYTQGTTGYKALGVIDQRRIPAQSDFDTTTADGTGLRSTKRLHELERFERHAVDMRVTGEGAVLCSLLGSTNRRSTSPPTSTILGQQIFYFRQGWPGDRHVAAR